MHNNIFHIFLLMCGFVFFINVIYLLITKKLNERLSIVWLAGSLIIFILSGNPELLDYLAHYIGIQYPPSLLFLLSTLVLLYLVLYLFIQISILNDKVKELTQHIALYHALEIEQDEIEKK